MADMWIHEGFTTILKPYMWNIILEKKAGEYIKGLSHGINNDIPIIGDYDVDKRITLEIFTIKLLQFCTLRQVNDDEKWRAILTV
jgi:hypothetical protein